MAGQAASRTVLFDLIARSQQHTSRDIQIKTASRRVPNDPAPFSGSRPASPRQREYSHDTSATAA